VAEACRNVVAAGATPIGATNCLNFGNPEKPEIMGQLVRAIAGIGEACRFLDVPITGGNVSLYNESATGPIYPTPIIGMVGRLPDARRAGRLGFAREGDAIALAGWDASPSLAGGELAKLWGEPLPDGLPAVDLVQAGTVLEAVRGAVRAGALSSCHDVAEGGLLVALAECCLAGGLGAALDLESSEEPWSELFGERPVGFLVSGPRDALDALGQAVPLDVFGTVGGDALELTIAGETSRWALAELREAHGALGRFFP
jgi:phosphoribosylformylglycinamidine synthase subunit PurL